MNPVCHGSFALVDPRSSVCGSCNHLAGCLSAARSQLDSLPDSREAQQARLRLNAVGVTVSRRGVARRALTPAEEGALGKLSARARGTAKRLAELGWFDLARSRMGSREVPAGAQNARIEQALRALFSGVNTRKQLVLAFMEQGLSPAAAQVEATTALAVLAFGRLVTLNGSNIQLSAN